MKRFGFFILCIFLSISFSFSQGKPVQSFSTTTHDFGDIYEEKGNASCDFIVKNTGDAPLVINNVIASCGCTTPVWTKEPIAPGASGTITATYAAKGRPGPFSKTISIYSNTETVVLTIKGNVLQKKLDPQEIYPVKMGSLWLQDNITNFGITCNTDTKKQTIEVYNSGKSPLSLKFDKLPKYLSVTSDQSVIQPNATAKINLIYNASMVKSYGWIQSFFNVIINDDTKNAASNKIEVNATITDDFKTMNATQIANAPKLNFSPGFINFDKVSSNSAQTTQVLKISNSGKSDLVIRSIKSDTPLVAVSTPKNIVKPGEIVEIKLITQAKKITNSLNGVINLVTNDPENSVKNVPFSVRP